MQQQKSVREEHDTGREKKQVDTVSLFHNTVPQRKEEGKSSSIRASC